MDDSHISEMWTSDSNIWQASEENELYITGTSEFIWYINVINNVLTKYQMWHWNEQYIQYGY